MRKIITVLTLATIALAQNKVQQQVTVVVSEHGATLHWAASPSPNVSAYIIYRRNQSDTDYPTSPIGQTTNLSFDDVNVTAGAQYCWAVTATNTSGQESVKSVETCATIPTAAPAPQAKGTQKK